MKNLFTFGCSFTGGNGCLSHEDYAKKYKLGDDHLIWPEIIAKELQLNLFNAGLGDIGNDKILDSVIDAYDLIDRGDIVIIEKTFTHRFDIPYKPNKPNKPNKSNLKDRFLTITPWSGDELLKQGYTSDEITHILYHTYLLDGIVNEARTAKRFEFLKKVLFNKSVKNCIMWDVMEHHTQFERIIDITAGEIKDEHWSYKGHRDFSKLIINKIDE